MRGILALLLSHTLLLSGLCGASTTTKDAPIDSTVHPVSAPLNGASAFLLPSASDPTSAKATPTTVTPMFSTLSRARMVKRKRAVGRSTLDDIARIYERRLSTIVGTVTDGPAIQNWYELHFHQLL